MKTFLQALVVIAVLGWSLFGLAEMISDDTEKERYSRRVDHFQIMATLAAGFLYLGRKEKE